MKNINQLTKELECFRERATKLKKQNESLRKKNKLFQEEIKRLDWEVEQTNRAFIKAVRMYERNSLKDEMTGLLNRQGFWEFVKPEFPPEGDHEQRKTEAVYEPGVLVYLDIDEFKNINDTLGHDTGDEIIMFFGSSLKEHFRRDRDVIARMHGDEFTLYLRGYGREDEVTKELEKIREEFEKRARKKTGIALTFSFGVCANNISFTKAKKVAEKRMYKNKAREKYRAGNSTIKRQG